MPSYVEYIQLEVRKDLAAFADAATQVKIVPSGAGLIARWIQNDSEREVFLTRTHEEFPGVEIGGRKLSYRAFLASEFMADLKRLAGRIARLDYGVRDFVQTRAEIGALEEAEGTVSGKATDLIRKLSTESLPWGATRLVFVRGAAGCGKTYILRKLAQDQAVEYELGETDRLFLYVDAQGKALARFDEAIAKELDDLRANFTYHAIGPLTRRGCLVVIVDGFDELLGSGGYDEAFASLSNFLGQLGGEGSVVASARSTFYDYKGFRRTAQKFAGAEALNFVVEPIDIHLWDREEVVNYFGRLRGRYPTVFHHPEGVYDQLIGSAGGRNRDLVKKPFYVAKIAELYGEGTQLSLDQELLPALVNRFVEREVYKLSDAGSHPILNKDAHHRFLSLLAEEMWWQETRQLDIPTVQTLAELLGEELKLTPMQVSVIVERAPSNAFLARRGNGGRPLLGFEHEVFYSYFIANRLQAVLAAGGPDLREFLSRATLPDSVIDEALAAQTWGAERIRICIQEIGEALVESTIGAVARENAGKIVRALIEGRKDLLPNLRFRRLVLKQSTLRNTVLVNPQFENCYFEELDLTGSSWTRPSFVNTTFNFPIIDPQTTRLEGAKFNLRDQIYGLFVYGKSGRERIHNPTLMAKALESVGAAVDGYEPSPPHEYSEAVKKRIELLDRFLRYAQRTFYVSREEPRLRQIFGAHEWEKVSQLLYHHGIVEDIVIQKSGPKQDLMKLRFHPDIIRDGEEPSAACPKEVAAFWRTLLKD